MISFPLILVIIVGVFVLVGILMYNNLVRLRNRTKEGWSDIETQLKRRYDLIPNLVETVKGYAKHERETFEKVTEMRASALSAQGIAVMGAAEFMLTDALKSLFAVSENYPDLKASQNFVELQKELTDTENKIQSARRFYNTTVLEYNTGQEVFPQSIVAKVSSGFSIEEFFELEEDEREEAKKAPDVSF